jgi:hypothetical protein
MAFELFHRGDESALLDISEDGELLSQFLHLLGQPCAGFGEGFPVHEGLLAHELQHRVVVSLDVLNLHFSHVEKRYNGEYRPQLSF